MDEGSIFPGRVFEALDADHGWLVSYGPGFTGFSGSSDDVFHYLVSRTSDGGATWQTAKVPGNYPGTVPAISFADSNHGYMLAAATRLSFGTSTVLRTSDGGSDMGCRRQCRLARHRVHRQ